MRINHFRTGRKHRIEKKIMESRQTGTVSAAAGRQGWWVVVALVLAVCLPPAEAFDGGDAAALVIGLVIGILGICSCLGYYARRRGA